MKHRRFTAWRFLLTILLGGSTWWLVGWWLSPRPWYTTEIDLAAWHASGFAPLESDKTETAKDYWARLSYVAQKDAWFIDQAGRYLLLKQSLKEINCRVIDLHQRQIVADYTLREQELVDHLLLGRLSPQPDIKRVFIVTSNTRHASRSSAKDPVRYSLWQWDVFTGVTQLIRQYPENIQLSLSSDGSTLLEVERRRFPSPTLYLPPSLPSMVAGQAAATLPDNDVAVYRVYSLPSMTWRCTITKPWLFRQDQGELSPQGSYLVFDDVALPPGYTSPLVHDPRGSVSSAMGTSTCYTLPVGGYLHRTQDGSLLSEYRVPDGSLAYLSTGDDRSMLFLNNRYLTQEREGSRTFHVPSLRWLDQELYVAYPRATGMLHTRGKPENQQSTVYSIATSGEVHAVGKMIGSDDRLLPLAPHYVRQKTSKSFEAIALPASWEDWLRQWSWLDKWLQAQPQLEVVDYTTQRVLLRHRGVEHYDYSDRWLAGWSDDFQTLRLAVYALPISDWSPWWARGAGLLVLVLLWWRWCQSKRHILP